ncbi:MAG: hypothetical protein ACYTF9_16610, partial [Planctomycetota bacterium]
MNREGQSSRKDPLRSCEPGNAAGRKRPLQVLVLSTFDGNNASVIGDFLFSFNAHSQHRYFYVFDCRNVSPGFDFTPYDVVLIFWSVYLLSGDISPPVMDAIAESRATKVLFLQDEYREVRQINGLMRRLGVQHMFSCAEASEHEALYPRSEIPSLEAVHTVLTGYVPRYLERRRLRLDADRPIDVGYRSRHVPSYLGDLGRQKVIIADRFRAAAAEHGLRCDISIREEDRIYGAGWIRFTRSCKYTLGTPSGASVIDLTGE